MHGASEKAVGFAFASAATGAIGSLGAPTWGSILSVVMTFSAAGFAWWMVRREKIEEAERRKRENRRQERLAATVEAMGANQIELAGMVARLLHPQLGEDEVLVKKANG